MPEKNMDRPVLALEYHDRPERDVALAAAEHVGDAAQPLPMVARLANTMFLRRSAVLLLLAVLWQGYAEYADNELMFPSLTDTLDALWQVTVTGEILSRVRTSVQVLLIGYSVGLGVAALLTFMAVSTRFGADVLSTLTSMFNPLPALATLPLALLWFGLGLPSLVFVITQSVVWTVSLNTLTGFQSVSDTLRMAGQNFGLRGVGYVTRLLVPAAFPLILTGLKLGWAFAWRTLIGAELIFGVTSRSGGLGWFIFENRTQLETPKVFAGLLVVILIGLAVETLIFRTIENRTVRKWGMQR
jgi:NitT/TauT family transport system permease protein